MNVEASLLAEVLSQGSNSRHPAQGALRPARQDALVRFWLPLVETPW